MTQDEIRRRLRALIDLPYSERPISVMRLEKLAGFDNDRLRHIAKETGVMGEKTRIRLEKALTWIENDQVVWKTRTPKPPEITIRPPRPPQKIVTIIEFKEGRPRVRFLAKNPLTFPDFREDPLTS